MRADRLELNGRRVAYLVLAALALGNAGCLVLAAGAAAGGAAAAGYAYVRGKVCQTYSSSLEHSWAAARTALGELGMPVLGEEHETAANGFIKTQTGDATPVRVFLDELSSPIPADGKVTRICVRVGTFGDDIISERVLNQISAHLVPAQPVAPPPGGPSSAPAWTPANGPAPITPTAAVQPAPMPGTTAPPPLLPAEPAPR